MSSTASDTDYDTADEAPAPARWVDLTAAADLEAARRLQAELDANDASYDSDLALARALAEADALDDAEHAFRDLSAAGQATSDHELARRLLAAERGAGAFRDLTAAVQMASDHEMALAMQAAEDAGAAPPTIMEVAGDGDCLFHALNVAMDGPIEREHPRVLRRKICDYLGRPAGDPMRLDGTYGTQVEVGAVCGLRGFEVVVYNDLGDLVYRTAPTDRDRELHGRPGSVYLICVGVRADGLAVTAEGEHYQPVAHANHATPAEVRALVINFRGPLRGAPRSEQRF